MRFLNTTTLKLEEPRDKPKYAILSHVWGDEEVSFRDINDPRTANSPNFTKIDRCCTQALEDGYKYVWVDTCCIDKSSSAELSEAINSMYRWYSEAEVCYAYLGDVRSDEDPAMECSGLRRSKWFTRGWTLQEVIAPRRVIFFAGDWVKIGTKASLSSIIARITGVDERVLLATLPLTEVSVARKMAWASRRQTTRVEDRAYSLMGIFGVHMPLIYGEGENSFIRLQHEIMKTPNDQSIFAWASDDFDRSALFAPSPSYFQRSTTIDRISPTEFLSIFASTIKDKDYKSHFSMTNSGVEICVPIKTTRLGYIAALACSIEGYLIGLYLQHCGGGLYQAARVPHIPNIAGQYHEFFAGSIIISSGTTKIPLWPASGRLSLPDSWGSVRVQTVRVAEEGFALLTHSLGQDLHTLGDGSLMYKPTPPNFKFILAYGHQMSEQAFVVTVGGQWRNYYPCVHIDTFVDREKMNSFISSYDCTSPCCKSYPDWAFKPLHAGTRVTATVTATAGAPRRCTATITVGHPRSAQARGLAEQLSS
ncbi:HET-domain-containing protein [Leucogyrophana mollusca]|uniref:HET-domain-containing protein n=1 Tax=Leucogyrophana mollusca TaxID=85980 RepID=A0ACB8BCM8_9AGAM|nr:HET-domain-containing protein [Leucogyrophana mollusca]